MRFRRSVLAVSLLAILFAIPAAARTTASSACPGSPTGFKTAPNVGATFSTNGLETTYFFSSFTNENPVDGVPGLIKYCVYPAGTKKNIPLPQTITPLAHGADGSAWIDVVKTTNFSFVRPGGNASDIPLDGKTTTMGTADWETTPPAQTILLHINDPTVCTGLYGATSPGTCFVLPGQNLALSCTDGDTTAAYNPNPFGVLHCPKFALGFEADSTNEFGDRDTLAKGGTSATLNVVFASYACATSGHWNTDDCLSPSTPGTYTLPTGHNFTARIYDPSDLVNPLAGGTSTLLAASTPIPFRPSKDETNCPGTGQFFDPLANGGAGGCKNAVAFFLTFAFPSLNLVSGNNYVWTVAFDTTHSGYNPIINDLSQPSCTSNPDPGCGWDALNVGYMFYTGAPYAGLDPSSAEAFQSIGTGALKPLHSTTTWPDPGESGRPLGEIITTP